MGPEIIPTPSKKRPFFARILVFPMRLLVLFQPSFAAKRFRAELADERCWCCCRFRVSFHVRDQQLLARALQAASGTEDRRVDGWKRRRRKRRRWRKRRGRFRRRWLHNDVIFRFPNSMVSLAFSDAVTAYLFLRRAGVGVSGAASLFDEDLVVGKRFL